MPRDRRQRDACAKDWIFTINYYDENMEEEFKRTLDTYCDYWIFGKERGQQGTDHYQGFLQLKVKARLRTVKTKLSLGRAHLEKRRGTAIEARDYCKKEGKWQEGGVIKAAGRSAGLGMAVENIQKNGE